MNNTNKKQHFNLVLESEVENTFKLFANQSLDVEIWDLTLPDLADLADKDTTSDDERLRESLIIVSYEHDDYSLIIKFKKEGFFKLTPKSVFINRLINFRIQSNKVNYFSNSKLTYNLDQDSYCLKIKPKMIYKAQLRSNYRLESSKLKPIHLVIDKIKHSVIDISSGGACLQFSIDTPLSEGMICTDNLLSISHSNYMIKQLEVLKIWEDDNLDTKTESPLRAGVKFTIISPKIEEKLTLDINNEARTQEIRKMLESKKA